MTQKIIPKNIKENLSKLNFQTNLDNECIKLTFKEEWDNGISLEELRTNLLKKVHIRWNDKLALAENKSFKAYWEKAIPIEDVRTHLLKTVRDL